MPASPPPAEPVQLFKPHENGPESISEILRIPTRKPLYCHPKSWCDLHLDALRVEGADKEYPVHHVLKCPVMCDPLDADLAELLQRLRADRGIFKNIMNYHARTGERLSRDMEESTVDVCYGILSELWKNVRRYPPVDTSTTLYEAFIAPPFLGYPFFLRVY